MSRRVAGWVRVLALAGGVAVLGSIGCDEEALPPGHGAGQPSALPTIWAFAATPEDLQKKNCDQAFVVRASCGVSESKPSWDALCAQLSQECVLCLAKASCANFSSCDNACLLPAPPPL